ncbi:hypothetical protein EG327_004116 [Venturia inaequalis]|uniref:Uncharacterized protein n=1 Tax=Venturia inaequalis TaxID=5025 RepID=A0A8H3Z650_VENIN|nr:hypothetical protein EG327_004116 [Venturia inaequalis]
MQVLISFSNSSDSQSRGKERHVSDLDFHHPHNGDDAIPTTSLARGRDSGRLKKLREDAGLVTNSCHRTAITNSNCHGRPSPLAPPIRQCVMTIRLQESEWVTTSSETSSSMCFGLADRRLFVRACNRQRSSIPSANEKVRRRHSFDSSDGQLDDSRPPKKIPQGHILS